MARKDAAKTPPERVPANTVVPDRRRWWLAASATLALGALVVGRLLIGNPVAEAAPGDTQTSHRAPATQAGAATTPQQEVMALVNGQDIRRETLIQGCVERHGEGVLESLVNKRLIDHHCRKRGLTVTDADIDAELDRMAKRFKLGREQWLELLEQQRGVSAAEYQRDILWPTLALRKLAGSELVVSDAELKKAYETRFGPGVQVRLIVVSDAQKAQQVQREAAARPAEFARLAMQHSEDINSASIGGLIQPIRLHVGEAAIERAAFSMQADEVSKVITVGPQHAIIKCEGHVPARNVAMAQVRAELEEEIREGKLREVANDLFAKLQNAATIQNVYNDPRLRQSMPGVVATVNGEPITMQELGQECLLRHGKEVLEVEVSHLALRQALQAAGYSVTQQDLESEMRHAARLAGVLDSAGEADMRRWVQMATEEQDVSYELYVRDSVWPSAALKKLTGDRVMVTDDDLKKGYEANYGERVRCLAIVMDDLRRAQEVWDKARQNPSAEYFGELAAEYSIEPSSRSLRGEAPPVRRYGGQPQLEEAAFALSPGEMSGITQVGDKFILLRCEGRTETLDIELAEVHDVLSQDIYEKKIRIAMSEEFDRLRSAARIDNYLTGTSQAPAKAEGQAESRKDTAVRQASGVR
ncbi:peptidylprolyl isomerase [Botrimarina hoheduenensis]|uniref:peptidylprolyl isomerase n=1 Tax=Botrimarina hoheduenensis TaxID=2528000 RepID=A0A5C5W8W9_9BACT|nr:peptidylprolyl isomerase [Botrimarina hoheduenensis]TWT47338.1 Foldase protein PrsA precursor [Botrimarina hoheduenensis]